MIGGSLGGWLKGEGKYLKRNPLVLAGIIALIGMRGYLALSGTGMMPQDSGCAPSEQVHASRLENKVYEWMMAHRFASGDATHVAMVTITEGSEPLRILNNTCDDREFLSVLISELASPKLKVKLIAIDQSYSDGSCLQETENYDLQNALQSAGVPVVVGARVHERGGKAMGGDCLVETPRFSFTQTGDKLKTLVRDNVHFGLLRLNADTLKIPISWWVFPDDRSAKNAKETKATTPEDGFAFAAAKLADPSLEKDWRITALAPGEHPYARFVETFDHWTAMDVICYGPNKEIKNHPDWGECELIGHVPFEDMADKIVVVGEHIDSEEKPFQGGTRYGMELHADYMEALLQRHFARRMPPLYDFGLVCLFLIVVIFLDALSMRCVGTRLEITPGWLAFWTALCFVAMLVDAFCQLWYRWVLMPYVLFTSVSIAFTVTGYFIIAAFNHYNAERKKADEHKKKKAAELRAKTL